MSISCVLCEKKEDLNPICNQNDGTITYFCDFHYAQAMGKDIGMLDRLKHTFRHRGGSMRGKPQKMSKKLFIGISGVVFTCIFFMTLNLSLMFKYAPLETTMALPDVSIRLGFGILVCIALGWYIYWKDNIKTTKGKIELIVSVVIGCFLLFYPIIINFWAIVQWLSYFF